MSNVKSIFGSIRIRLKNRYSASDGYWSFDPKLTFDNSSEFVTDPKVDICSFEIFLEN